MTIQDLLSAIRSYKAGTTSLKNLDTSIEEFKAHGKKKKVKETKTRAQVEWALIKLGIRPDEFTALERNTKEKTKQAE